MKCSLCNREINQYQGRNRTKCGACNHRLRRQQIKKDAVKLLGGICQRCGQEWPDCVFDFHHVNGTKDFNISKSCSKSWETTKRELAKCRLLCANCHRMEEEELRKVVP